MHDSTLQQILDRLTKLEDTLGSLDVVKQRRYAEAEQARHAEVNARLFGTVEDRNAYLVELASLGGLRQLFDARGPGLASKWVHEAPAEYRDQWADLLGPDARAVYDSTYIFEVPKYVRLKRSAAGIVANFVYHVDWIQLTKEGAADLLAHGGDDYYSTGRYPQGQDRGHYLVPPRLGPLDEHTNPMPVQLVNAMLDTIDDEGRLSLRKAIASGMIEVQQLSDDECGAIFREYLSKTPVAKRRPLPLRAAKEAA